MTAPVAPPALAPIVSFSGPYWFLANPCPAPVIHEGIQFPSAEHAFQAAKTLDWDLRVMIARTTDWRAAKRGGRQLPLRSGWDQLRRPVMLQVVLDKFTRNPDLGRSLVATGDRVLIEGNIWGDTGWGAVYPGDRGSEGWRRLPLWYDGAGGTLAGRNWLGWSLMTVRDVLTEVS